MRHSRPVTAAIALFIVGVFFAGGGTASVGAQTAPDRSDVVLVLDFSASILRDEANRNRFGTALEQIADRVDATSADLVAGDATVSIVQFASKAADYPGCADLRLLGDPAAVAHLADCLRSVAGDYRKGLDPALTRKIGVDTNYVAAMEQAAKHLPADAVRPTMILFTDGKHDVKGVPVSEVAAAQDRLFGSRTPFALLPVGMGLESKDRDALQAGLGRLQVIKGMPSCVSGTTFEWPQVVFESAEDAGSAVAVALQNATCTFTVAPSPTPEPAPVPTPGRVTGIRATPGDGQVVLEWTAPAKAEGVTDYMARCRSGDGADVESTEGTSAEPKAVVTGLTNGLEYRCEVAAVDASAPGAWTPASATVTPFGRPAAPGELIVVAENGAVRINVPADVRAGATDLRYECSGDGGNTWDKTIDVGAAGEAPARIGGLTNGVSYVCRAFAVNATGQSDPSPVSAAVLPCGSTFECNPLLTPVFGVVGAVLAVILALLLVAFIRSRNRGYVLAVVDVVHTANLGRGSKLGIAFIRDPRDNRVTGIEADPHPMADVHLRPLRGNRFEIKDRLGKRITSAGESVVVVDAIGGRHELVLRAFETNAASKVSSRR